ncbi:MAG: 16S rRNA (cytosine(1402)-N(4))-methyltransferase RsmH [Fibrobacterota bacterium]
MMTTSNYHVPVLLEQTLEKLRVQDGGVFLDGTLGGAGHSIAMAKLVRDTGRVIGLDRDVDALLEARKRSEDEGVENLYIRQGSFGEMESVLHSLNVSSLQGILLDIGVSSHQIDEPDRGFSYRFDGVLDMRMNREQELSARTVLTEYEESRLEVVLREYGEVHGAAKMASGICRYRKTMNLVTTRDLVALLEKIYGSVSNKALSKIFQAVRIEVNDELGQLSAALQKGVDFLAPGGRIAVIAYHSLEDRMVKNYMRSASRNCICPSELPVCSCGGNRAILKSITKKPVIPAHEEIRRNPRARSARLRVAERI